MPRIFYQSVSKRAQYVLATLKRAPSFGFSPSRTFDACFEQHDADELVRKLHKLAMKDTTGQRARDIDKLWGNTDWRDAWYTGRVAERVKAAHD